MKKTILPILIIVALGFGLYWGIAMGLSANEIKEETPNFLEMLSKNEVKNGDIIFQSSKSSQSIAIQLATNSKYSHRGIIYKIDDQLFVYEAVQAVKLTPLEVWINRGEKGHYVIKRLRDSDHILSQTTFNLMKQVGERFKGKDYDVYFEWSDEKIYCSELVWKIYKEGAGIEIGELQKLSDFDLNSDLVQQKMKERYGENIPMEETVISPAQMFNSEKLELIKKN